MEDEYSLEGSAPTFAQEEIQSPPVPGVIFDCCEDILHGVGVVKVDGGGICVIVIPKPASDLLQSMKYLL
jgi:hypothetical protein